MNDIPSFSSLFSEHNTAAMVDSFTGFSFTHVATFRQAHNLVSTLSIKPRTFEKQYAAQVGEQQFPGSAQVVLLGSAQGLTYRVGSHGLWHPSLFLSIPFATASVDFSASVGHSGPELKLDVEQRFPHCVAGLSLEKGAAVSIDAALSAAARMLRWGAGVGYNATEAKFDCRAVADVALRRAKIGALVTTDFRSSVIALLTAQRSIGDTKVATQLTVVPLQLASNLALGFEREFSRSNVAASFSTNGILSSVYTRVINRSVRLTLSSTINIGEQDYGFGVSVSLS